MSYKSENPYWEEVMSKRTEFRDEVTRLTTILYGFYYQNDEEECHNILDHWGSKRPYGNKDVAASIAFNLGWDYQRRLCTEHMPKWVEEEAMMLHETVYLNLIKGN